MEGKSRLSEQIKQELLNLSGCQAETVAGFSKDSSGYPKTETTAGVCFILDMFRHK